MTELLLHMNNYFITGAITAYQTYSYFKKYNCMSKIFPKIHLKFYFNVITHNQIYEYV